MIIELYKTMSDNNTINKDLPLATMIPKQIVFKDYNDVDSPSIKLKMDSRIRAYNYVKIPELEGRCYFLNRIIINSNRMMTLELELDVLETYKDDILKCSALISKSENGNPYLDTSRPTEVLKEVDSFESDISIDLNKQSIITTVINTSTEKGSE